MLLLSFFGWSLLSIGMFMEPSFLHLHLAIPLCVLPTVMAGILFYWGRTFSYPRVSWEFGIPVLFLVNPLLIR